MARFTEKYWNGRWWSREEWDAMLDAQRAAQPDAPQVIRDSMDLTFNHATRQFYDSKRAYERDTRRAGCVIVGNERLPERKPVEMPRAGHDIKRAIEQLRGRP